MEILPTRFSRRGSFAWSRGNNDIRASQYLGAQVVPIRLCNGDGGFVGTLLRAQYTRQYQLDGPILDCFEEGNSGIDLYLSLLLSMGWGRQGAIAMDGLLDLLITSKTRHYGIVASSPLGLRSAYFKTIC